MGELTQAHAHGFDLHADDRRGVASVMARGFTVEFVAEIDGDLGFVGFVVRSVFVEVFQHAVDERAEVGRVDFPGFGIEGLKIEDLREIEAQRTFQVVLEPGDTERSDWRRGGQDQVERGDRRWAAELGRRIEKFGHARGQLFVGAAEEQTRRAVGFTTGTETTGAEAEVFGSMAGEQRGEQISIASQTRILRRKPEPGANAIGQEGIFGRAGGQCPFAAPRDGEDGGAGPWRFKPTLNFASIIRSRREDRAGGEGATEDGLAERLRLRTEERGAFDFPEDFHENFKGRSARFVGSGFVVIKRGEKLARSQMASLQDFEGGEKSVDDGALALLRFFRRGPGVIDPIARRVGRFAEMFGQQEIAGFDGIGGRKIFGGRDKEIGEGRELEQRAQVAQLAGADEVLPSDDDGGGLGAGQGLAGG